jgi:hypothetical protein
MSELQTTKIGDRWFLVFEERMIPVDSVKEMGFTGDVQRLTTKDGSVRIETPDNEYFVTPVKPSGPIAGTQAEAIIRWANEHVSRIE